MSSGSQLPKVALLLSTLVLTGCAQAAGVAMFPLAVAAMTQDGRDSGPARYETPMRDLAKSPGTYRFLQNGRTDAEVTVTITNDLSLRASFPRCRLTAEPLSSTETSVTRYRVLEGADRCGAAVGKTMTMQINRDQRTDPEKVHVFGNALSVQIFRDEGQEQALSPKVIYSWSSSYREVRAQ